MAASLLVIFETIGSIVGILITLITFFGLISKRPREAFRRVIREETEKSNSELKNKLEEIEEQVGYSKENDIALIRNTITHIYFKYQHDKKIPHYEKENIISLFERYEKMGGNSYVHSIMTEIQNWEEII